MAGNALCRATFWPTCEHFKTNFKTISPQVIMMHLKLVFIQPAFRTEPLSPVIYKILDSKHIGLWVSLDPSATEWRCRRQPKSSGAGAAEKQTARRRAS